MWRVVVAEDQLEYLALLGRPGRRGQRVHRGLPEQVGQAVRRVLKAQPVYKVQRVHRERRVQQGPLVRRG